MVSGDLPLLYTDLADWWQVVSPTSDYADEGPFFRRLFREVGAHTILELGSGGGNVAWYLKAEFEMTLADLSPQMLDVSKRQNPELEHIVGDMRSLRLGRTFDGVFIHDAVMYMLTEADLRAAFVTAAAHLRPGGTLVVAPDCTRETFVETTLYEGHDEGRRAARYIQWISDPDPTDTIFDYDLVFALKDGDQLHTVVDRQHCGLFPKDIWLRLMDEAGFAAHAVADSSTQGESVERLEVFVGTLRG